MEKVERILVNDQAIAVNSVSEQARDAAKVINSRLIPALEAIGIQATNEVLKDCMSGAAATQKAYFADVAQDIKATRTPSIRKQMEEAAGEAWAKFQNEVIFCRREARNYKHLTITDGKAELTAANAEKLADGYRTYLTDPKEIAAYKLHVEIVEKLNQLFNGSAPYRWQSIFPEDANGHISRNDETNYSHFV